MKFFKKIKLVKNKNELWRHYSKQALAVVGLAQGIWAVTPDSWVKSAPSWVVPAVAGTCAVIAVLGLFGALIQQPMPSNTEPEP